MTNELTKEQFEDRLKLYQDSYTRGSSAISDDEFDRLVDQFEKKFGVTYSKVGAEPTGEKVKLPYYMSSMDKSKGDDAQPKLDRFAKKFPGPYNIADKLDGASAMYVQQGAQRSLYTRGDGTYGVDISHIIQYINLPTPNYDIIAVGELVLPIEEFKKVGGSNPRNVGTGFINSKSPNIEDLKRLHFVGYNIRQFSQQGQQFPVGKQSGQLGYLKLMGFELPWYGPITTNEMKVDTLTSYLQQRKLQSPYDIDGLVITDDSKEFFHLSGQNPDHVIGFKVDTMVHTKVLDIEWNASKDGKLKPIVHFEPRNIVGAVCSKANGNNAKFIYDTKLGIGSELIITRSGDVIPYIVKVLTPGTSKWPTGNYKWNESNVELVLVDPENDPQVQKEKMLYFIKHMGIENIGPGVMDLIYDAGYTSIKALLNVTVGQLSVIPRLGVSSGAKIVDQIQYAINNVPLYKVMVSSGQFGEGFGLRRMNDIMTAHPDIFNYMNPPGTVTQMVRNVGGFNELASVFESKMQGFLAWLQQHPEIRYILNQPQEAKISNGDLQNQVFVFSGIIAKNFRPGLLARGAQVVDSYNNSVTTVVAVDPSVMSGKVKSGQKAGKKIISLEEFKRTYGFQ